MLKLDNICKTFNKGTINEKKALAGLSLHLEPGDFVHTLGDAHLYRNHLDQARLQLTREPRPLPRMIINSNVKNINDFVYEDFTLEGYDPHPHIKAEVSV